MTDRKPDFYVVKREGLDGAWDEEKEVIRVRAR